MVVSQRMGVASDGCKFSEVIDNLVDCWVRFGKPLAVTR